MRLLILLTLFTGLAVADPAPIIRVTLLGTGTPLLSDVRMSAGLMVEAGGEVLLFDCGRGIPVRLSQAGPNYPAVNQLFLSHLHSDHTEGIPDLWTSGWPYRWDQPLNVYGPGLGPDQPVGTAGMMSRIPAAWATDVHIRRDLIDHFPDAGIAINTTEISEGVVYLKNGVKVTAFKVDHRPVDPAFGYRVDYQGHSMVYSGDTRPSANLVTFALGTDVLIHEVYGYPTTTPQAAYHTTPEQAAGVFNQVRAKLAVYTHLATPEKDSVTIQRTRAAGYAGPLVVGRDLMRIDIFANRVQVPESGERE